MASITAPDVTRAPARTWRKDRMRAALARAWRKGTEAVSAARHHNWSPALTAGGLAAIDIAAWETFGRGAAWLALGISLLLFEWQRSD